MIQKKEMGFETPIEYFIKNCEFKFCFTESQDPDYAENLIEEIYDTK